MSYLAAILDISTVTWPRISCNIPNWRSFHSEHKWSLDILWLELEFPSYFDIFINLAAILENGGYRRSATYGRVAPSKLLFCIIFCFQWHMTHHLIIKTATGKVFSATCPRTKKLSKPHEVHTCSGQLSLLPIGWQMSTGLLYVCPPKYIFRPGGANQQPFLLILQT